MRFVMATGIGILGVVMGYCLVAFVSYGVAGLAGMSDFEGGRAMFAAFVMGPVGAVFGFFAGCFGGWKLGGGPVTANHLMVLFIICLFAVGAIYELFVMG